MEYNVGDIVRVLNCDDWFAERGLDSTVGEIIEESDIGEYRIRFDRGIEGVIGSMNNIEHVYTVELFGDRDFSDAEVFI